MTGGEVVTLVLAIYAAGLSTFVAARQVRLDRARLKFTTAFLYPMNQEGFGGAWLKVTVVNTGQRPTTVTWMSLELPYKRTLSLQDVTGTPLPVLLGQGQSAEMTKLCSDIAAGVRRAELRAPVKIRPICTDGEGRRHRGPRITVEPDEWSKL